MSSCAAVQPNGRQRVHLSLFDLHLNKQLQCGQPREQGLRSLVIVPPVQRIIEGDADDALCFQRLQLVA